MILTQGVHILMYFKNIQDVVCQTQGLLTLTLEGGEAPLMFTGLGVPTSGCLTFPFAPLLVLDGRVNFGYIVSFVDQLAS